MLVGIGHIYVDLVYIGDYLEIVFATTPGVLSSP